MNNKGGVNLDVVLFVFLSLFIFTSTLFTFNSNLETSMEATISGAYLFNDAKYEEKVSELYLEQFLEDSAILAYNEILISGDYVKIPLTMNGERKFIFDNLRDGLNDLFLSRINMNLPEEFNKYNYEDVLLDKIKDNLKFKETSVTDDGFYYIVPYLETFSEGNVAVEVPINLEVKMNFDDLGLDSFKEIYNSKEKCKLLIGSNEVKQCFESELEWFDVSVSEIFEGEVKNYFVELSSKRAFEVLSSNGPLNPRDPDSKKVVFSFIMK